MNKPLFVRDLSDKHLELDSRVGLNDRVHSMLTVDEMQFPIRRAPKMDLGAARPFAPPHLHCERVHMLYAHGALTAEMPSLNNANGDFRRNRDKAVRQNVCQWHWSA